MGAKTKPAAGLKGDDRAAETVRSCLERALVLSSKKTKNQKANGEAALLAMVEAWRLNQSPVLAELIDHVAAPLKRRPLGQGSLTHMNAHWLDVASKRDPHNLPRLVQSLSSGRSASAVARLRQLVEFPDDPRIASGLAMFYTVTPFHDSASLAKALVTVRDLILRIADVRVLPGLAPFEKDNAKARELAIALRETIEKAWPESRRLMSEEEQAIHRKLEERYAGAISQDVLLAAIYAAPDEDGPREVYADWLLEHDVNPEHAELITMQLAEARGTALSSEAKTRMQEIVRKQERTLLGGLAKIAAPRTTTFRRGFVSSFAVEAKNQRTLIASFALPEWSTVEEVSFSTFGSGPPADVLALPCLRQLRRVSYVNLELASFAATKLTEPHRALIELGVHDYGSAVADALPVAFGGDCPGLPHLEILCLHFAEPWPPSVMAPVLLGGFGSRLKCLMILRASFADLSEWLDLVDPTSITRFELDAGGLILERPSAETRAWTLGIVETYFPAVEKAEPLRVGIAKVAAGRIKEAWVTSDLKHETYRAGVQAALKPIANVTTWDVDTRTRGLR